MFAPQRPTALAKILGVYRIGYKNSQNNTEKKLDLLVMENLFYGRKMAQVRDVVSLCLSVQIGQDTLFILDVEHGKDNTCNVFVHNSSKCEQTCLQV